MAAALNSTITLRSTTPPSSIPLLTSINPPSIVIQTSTSFSTLALASSSLLVPPTSTLLPPSTSIAVLSTPQSISTQSVVTSIITLSATNNGVPSIVIITSTASGPPVDPEVPSSTATSSSALSTSSNAPAIANSDTTSTTSGGLTPAGRTAIGVVVPLAVVALLVAAALFFWRRRKQRKDAEELRKKEMEDYNFNPNKNPTLPAVGAVSSQGGDRSEMKEADGAGYRGWGTTPNARKPSSTLPSGTGPIGVARSDSGGQSAAYQPSSPGHTPGTAHNSDVQSGDPLIGRPTSADSETIGALGVAPTANSGRPDRGVHRGPSNASSAYSGANKSEASGEGSLPGHLPSPQHYQDGAYYDESMPPHSTYRDGAFGNGGHPVIRDVQAKRNTRIENPGVLPQPGNAGIAQNF